MSNKKDIHKYTIEFTENFWLNLVEVAGTGKVKQFIIQALKVALEAHTIKSLILAGGRGTGFRPVNVAIPAVMLPIGYKPILQYCIDLLLRHALTDIYLSVGYLKEHIQNQFPETNTPGKSISLIAEEKPLDTAGAVLNAQKNMKSTFLVMNGDLITNVNVNDMLEFHRKSVKEGGIATMFIIEDETGQVEFDIQNKRIVHFNYSRKKGLGYNNAGIYIFEPEIFEYITKEVSSLEKNIFPELANENLIYGYLPEAPVYWNHINSPEKFTQGWADYLAGKLGF